MGFHLMKNQCPSTSVRPLGMYEHALYSGEMRSMARDMPGWDRDITRLRLNEVRQDNLDDALRKQQMVWKEEKGG